MNLEQLRSKVDVSPSGHGHYKVTIEYRNKEYFCITNNMVAIDTVKNEEKSFYYTEKQALLSLWDECKEKNNLI